MEKKVSHQSTFKLNEVCSIAGVKPYVLRFWESEFHEISPRIDEDDIRYYDHQDIEAITLIKKLLFEEKLTIEKTKLELKLRIVGSVDDQVQLEDEPKEENILNQEKLILAKEKLSSIIALTDSLKQSHNWN
ncbi:MAG: MerR family transcriptional regulator [Bdellovibrionota bacterium]|nr:MerR family transcriptional regulator [Bdellovibrionota bacterium]